MSQRLRFIFILVVAAIGVGLAAAGGWHYARASAPVNGPIILISIDALRADHLPAYGYGRLRTPAIDALASDGTVFERAYSHATLTLPAHASMLSGRLPFETGVRDNAGFAIRRGERLLPQMLRERGYATAGIVSSWILRRDTGIDQGFDLFDANLGEPSEDRWIGPLERDGAASEAIAESWIGEQRSARLFLFLHLYEPHAPYTPPPQYAAYAPYDGEIAYADEIVGRLIRYLKAHQLYDRSTIVLTSDHGEGLGEHGEQEHGLLLHEEAIHVPLILKQPAGVDAGRRIAEIVQQIDIVPTILDLAKAPIPGNLRGRSLKRILDGSEREPEAVYSEALYGRYHFGWSPMTAVTQDGFRYIKAPREELYDLVRDPHETANLVERGSLEPLAALRSALEHAAGRAAAGPAAAVSDADRRRFASLGYVGWQGGSAGTADGDADPKDFVPIVEVCRRAAELAARGELSAAVDVLHRAAREHSGAIQIWTALGDVLSLAGRFEPAARAYDRAAALAPENPASAAAAAAAFLESMHLEEAARRAEAALATADARSAARAEAELILARIAAARRDAEAARAHAARAQKADARLPAGPFIEGLLAFGRGDFEEAAEQLQAVRTDSPPPDLHLYAGEALSRLQRWDEAAAELERELESWPFNLRARASLAVAYHALGRTGEAAALLDAMPIVAPAPESYALAARAWAAIGEPRRADALRAEARRRFRGDPALAPLSGLSAPPAPRS